MRIHNLYVDDKGETHFRDVQGRMEARRPRRQDVRHH